MKRFSFTREGVHAAFEYAHAIDHWCRNTATDALYVARTVLERMDKGSMPAVLSVDEDGWVEVQWEYRRGGKLVADCTSKAVIFACSGDEDTTVLFDDAKDIAATVKVMLRGMR